MKTVSLLLILIPLLSLFWWLWANWRLRLNRVHISVRYLLAVGMLVFFAGYIWVILTRDHLITGSPPSFLLAIVLLWGLIFLPFFAIPFMGGWSLWRIIQGVFRKSDRDLEPGLAARPWSRRKWLTSCVTLFPLIGNYSVALASLNQLSRFRVHHVTLTLPTLPPGLNGLKIAHVTDSHIGKFTNELSIDRIVSTTNRLNADLVLFTGDLIDYSIDALPEGIRMLQGFRAKYGVFCVEGNHDLMDDAASFQTLIRAAGIHLLTNQAAHLRLGDVTLDLLGIKWSHSSAIAAVDVAEVAAIRQPDAFSILLSHHPHAFDHAVNHQIPLTLAGHTHGGQLMLNSKVGVGSAMFRYWTGLYRKQNCALYVSNGVGNWFPIRVNAPAEIVCITLRNE